MRMSGELSFYDTQAMTPLASRMRPRELHDLVGQDHLVGPSGILTKLLAKGQMPSFIFWGPPGTGKTTVAEVLCQKMRGTFQRLSAINASVKDIREIAEKAKANRDLANRRTYLFLDEIHRFNKAQQDALLPYVEDGTFTLLAATTENPSFYVNSALLSRCRVLIFNPLTLQDLEGLLERVLKDKDKGLGQRHLQVDDAAKEMLLSACGFDARALLTILEVASDLLLEGQVQLTRSEIEAAVGRKMMRYDKSGDGHYDVISAFIKSLRGSDVHAAVHYLARMLEAGEDARFVARRMVIFASEDIGNADPQAIQVAVAAMQAFDAVGMPEGYLPLTHAATYLACAPKSNAVITAYQKAKADLLKHGHDPVPLHLRNAPTQLLKALGHGKAYRYPHDFEGNHVPDEQYLPDDLCEARYYVPTANGYERFIKERLAKLERRTPT